jgi:hypothetical protein
MSYQSRAKAGLQLFACMAARFSNFFLETVLTAEFDYFARNS